MKQILVLVILVGALGLLWGCSGTPAPAPSPSPVEPPAASSAPSRQPIPQASPTAAKRPAEAFLDVEAWKLVADFSSDEAKAKRTYQGKALRVKNLLVYEVQPSMNRVDAFAFDPATKKISTTGQNSLQKQPLVAADDFFVEIYFAVPKTAAALKKDECKPGPGKQGLVFSRLITVEARFHHEMGNLLTLERARLHP
jgi:hypothetical protein